MEIITANDSIGFRVNKTMVGAPWHKKNLGKIISAGGGRTAILPAMSYAIDIVMVIIIFFVYLNDNNKYIELSDCKKMALHGG